MYIAPEEEARLKLEIWREIMRAKETYYPGGMGGGTMRIPVPDPVVCAGSAVNTYNALYPTPVAKPAAKKPATKKRTKHRGA